MNVLLWILQGLAALLYGASGIMKLFLLDTVRDGVQSFDALPREAWMALGVLELLCAAGLVVPAALRWRPALTALAAITLALESLVFIWVHAQYGESASIALSCTLGLLMAFVAYGRAVARPIVPRATASDLG